MGEEDDDSWSKFIEVDVVSDDSAVDSDIAGVVACLAKGVEAEDDVGNAGVEVVSSNVALYMSFGEATWTGTFSCDSIIRTCVHFQVSKLVHALKNCV